MFNKCVEWKFAKSNPMENVELFKLDTGRTRHLSAKEAQTLIAACNSDLRILVLAAMHTGFRKSELQSLTWSAVDRRPAVTVELLLRKERRRA